MKKLLAAAILSTTLAYPCFAQTSPNPEVVTYQQLLTEANERVAKLSAQIHALTADNTRLKSELAAAASKQKEAAPK